MYFILIASLVILLALTLVLLLASVLLRLTLFRNRERRQRSWPRTLLRVLIVAVLTTLVVVPTLLGYAGSRLVRTRGDESAYAGPRFDEQGRWLLQSRESLKAEARGPQQKPASRPSQISEVIWLESEDGLRLRTFLVAPRQQPPTARVILVHGLFRGGLELEQPARMFRNLGAEVLILELRNHGESDHAPATYGLRESRDVLAAARFMGFRSSGSSASGPKPPLILYGVSMGAAAVALAAPEVKDLAGLVLDAPMTDLSGAAHRALTESGPRFPGLVATAALTCMELWSGFDLDSVHVDLELAKLDPGVQVLFIGAGLDQRMPPAVVTKAFEALEAPPTHKKLWIVDGARHGRVWEKDPQGYQQRLADLLARVRSN